MWMPVGFPKWLRPHCRIPQRDEKILMTILTSSLALVVIDDFYSQTSTQAFKKAQGARDGNVNAHTLKGRARSTQPAGPAKFDAASVFPTDCRSVDAPRGRIASRSCSPATAPSTIGSSQLAGLDCKYNEIPLPTSHLSIEASILL